VIAFRRAWDPHAGETPTGIGLRWSGPRPAEGSQSRRAYAIADLERNTDHISPVPYTTCRGPQDREAGLPARLRTAWNGDLSRHIEIGSGVEIDGFRCRECLHAGAMGRIFRVNGRRRAWSSR